MKTFKFEEVVVKDYSAGAIVRDDFPGFKEDYLVVHSIIKKYAPKTFMEIGTSSGMGTKVICNAMGIKRFWLKRKDVKVYSIDVPPGTDPKIIYPEGEDGHPVNAGESCKLRYTQIFGNSNIFDFSPYYPIEGWFIDGKHDYKFVQKDTLQAIKSDPKVIIWHDVDIPSVCGAIVDVMGENENYDLYRVEGTRVAFVVKK